MSFVWLKHYMPRSLYARAVLILLLPVATWYLFSLLDLAVGLNTDNADPDTSEADMFW